MKLPTHLILSLLHSLSLIIITSSCQPYFPCGALNLSFPFTDIREPHCGLFTVDGCNCSTQTVRLEAGGFPYHLLHVHPNNNTFRVRDSHLGNLINQKRYVSLTNLSLPKFPFHSLTFASQNLTLFICQNYVQDAHEKNFRKNISASFIPRPPHENCDSGWSRIQVPAVLEEDQDDDPFQWLTPDFTLSWHVSDDCHRCQAKGGQCLSNYRNKLYCKREASRLPLILAVPGVGLPLLLLCLLLLFCINWLHRKMKTCMPIHVEMGINHTTKVQRWMMC